VEVAGHVTSPFRASVDYLFTPPTFHGGGLACYGRFFAGALARAGGPPIASHEAVSAGLAPLRIARIPSDA